MSTGSACTSASVEPSYVLRALGLPDALANASIRLGLGRFTTADEVDFAADALAAAASRLYAEHGMTQAETVPYIDRSDIDYASERENSFDGDGAQTGFVGDRRGGRAHPGAARQPRQAVGRRARRRAVARLLGPQLHARIRRREGQVRRNRRGQGRDGAGRSEGRHVHPRHRDGLRRGEAAIRLRLPQPERKGPLRLRRESFHV